jgi:hypothetical protein
LGAENLLAIRLALLRIVGAGLALLRLLFEFVEQSHGTIPLRRPAGRRSTGV